MWCTHGRILSSYIWQYNLFHFGLTSCQGNAGVNTTTNRLKYQFDRFLSEIALKGIPLTIPEIPGMWCFPCVCADGSIALWSRKRASLFLGSLLYYWQICQGQRSDPLWHYDKIHDLLFAHLMNESNGDCLSKPLNTSSISTWPAKATNIAVNICMALFSVRNQFHFRTTRAG